MYGKKTSDAVKKKLSDRNKGNKNPMYGKNIKDFMSEDAYNALLEKRRQFMIGRKVMVKNGIRRKIKPQDFQKYLDDGWEFIKVKR